MARMTTARKLLLGLLGGGGVAFSPLSIPGLALWLDASDSATLFQDSAGTTPATTDGDVVGYWGDKSTGVKHMTQATTAQKPTLQLAEQNGRHAIQFDGSDVLFRSGVVTTSTAWTVFTAAKLGAGATQAIFANGTATVSNVAPMVWKNTGNRNISLANANCVDGAATTSAEIWTTRRTTAPLAILRINGASQAITNDTAAQATPTVGAFVGAALADTTYAMTGFIYEILMYSAALTDDQLAQVEAYLSSKWGIV
jgi:hypothetical protein